ncbi:alpha/beta hydrolase fold domain-containing protein, partial [Pedobacter sp.]|uniref:alpha/beta hydrolase fold domain-containing protein n=1 Tax=Pedobacter sp. TaxID=1411316 RepID=UPI003C515C72
MKTIFNRPLLITALLFLSLGASAQVIDPAMDPRIDAQVKAFLKVLNSGSGKPVEQLSPKEARAVLTGAQESVTYDYSDIIVSEKLLPAPGGKVSINIVKPKYVKGILPVFLYIHGGGWVLGDFPTHKRLVRDLVINSGAAAVFVNYTPSPEAHYPVAINQEYAVLQWLAGHGAEIGVDASRLAVVGNSVGGNMTAAIALMAKNKKGPAIRLQVLLWP